MQDADGRLSVERPIFQVAAHSHFIALHIPERPNKRAAFHRQRERNDDHFTSVTWTMIDIFSAELADETSPFTSFTPGR